MKVTFLFFLFSIVFYNNSFSQDSEKELDSFRSINNEFNRPKLIYKLALLSQLDFNSPSLQFGLEISLSDRIGLHQELGYVNNWLNPIYTLIDHEFSKKIKIKNGFKYIIEPRFYVFNQNKLFFSKMFFAPAFDFRYVVIQRKEWLNVNNLFRQNFKYNVQKLEYGLNLKFGFTTSIKKLLPIEMVVGVGARYISLTNTLPFTSSVSQGANNFLVRRPAIEGSYFDPSIYIGMLMQLPFQKK